MSKKDLVALAREFQANVPFRTITRTYAYSGKTYTLTSGRVVDYKNPIRILDESDSWMKWSDLSRKLVSHIETDFTATVAAITAAFNAWVDDEFEAEIMASVADMVCGDTTESLDHQEILVNSVEARYTKLNALLAEKPLPREFSSFKIERKVAVPKPNDIDDANWDIHLPFEFNETGISFKTNALYNDSEFAYLRFLALPYVAVFAQRVLRLIHEEEKR